MILICNEINNCSSYKTFLDYQGRFIKVKLQENDSQSQSFWQILI